MIDFEIMERSLKLAWIKRIAENNHAAWKIIPKQTLSQYGGFAFFTQCQCDINFCDLQNLPEFYRTILSYWQNFKLYASMSTSLSLQVRLKVVSLSMQ